MITHADRANQKSALLIGKRLLGTSYTMLGKGAEATRLATEAITGHDVERDRDQALNYVQDNRIAALTWSSLACWYLGQSGEARRRAIEAIHAARKSESANTLAQSLSIGGGVVHDLLGDTSAMAAFADELSALTDAHNLPFWRAFYEASTGRCHYHGGKFDLAVGRLRAGIEQFKEQNVIRWQSLFLSWLAEAHLAAGEPAAASEILIEAERAMRAAGDYWHLPQIKHLEAAIATTGQREILRSALQAAASMEAPAWVLRLSIDILRLGESQSTDLDMSQLRSAMANIDEDLESCDLRAARNLLKAHAAT